MELDKIWGITMGCPQARCQDSVTGGGGRNKFWGGTRNLFMWIWEGHGSREIYPSLDQMHKVKTKKQVKTGFSSRKQMISLPPKKGLHWNSKSFSGRNQKFKRFFRPKTGDLQKKKKKVFTEILRVFLAEIRNSNVFSSRKQVISKK